MNNKLKIAFVVIGLAVIIASLIYVFAPDKSERDIKIIDGARVELQDNALQDWINYDNSTRTMYVNNPDTGKFLGSITLISPKAKHCNSPSTCFVEYNFTTNVTINNPIQKVELFAYRNSKVEEALERTNHWVWWNKNAVRTEYNMSCYFNATAPINNQSCAWIPYNVSGDWKPYLGGNIPAGTYRVRQYIEMEEHESIEYVPTFLNVTIWEWDTLINDGNTLQLMHFNGANASTAYIESAAANTTNHTYLTDNKAWTSNDIKKFGAGSLYCDGTSAKVYTDNNSSDFQYGSSQAFTLDFWVYPTAIGGNQVIWFYGREDTQGNLIALMTATGAIRTMMAAPSAWTVDYTSNITLSNGNWQHVAIQRTAAGVVQTWINGTLAGSGSTTNAGLAGTDMRMVFCAMHGSNYFKGYVDEVRYSNVARYNTSTLTLQTQEYWGSTTTPLSGLATILSPPSGYNQTSSTIQLYINLTAVGTNATVNNVTCYANNNVNVTVLGNGTNNATNISFSGLADNLYVTNCTAWYSNLTASYSNTTGNVNIRTDGTAPSVSITFPANGQIYINNITTLNYSISDGTGVGLSYCWWMNETGVNVSISCTGSVTYLNRSDGTYTWKVYANDTLNNIGSATTTFTINTVPNNIVISHNLLHPADNYNTNANSLFFASNATIAGGNFSNATLYLDGVGSNTTTLSLNNGFANRSLAVTEGMHNWTYRYCATNATSSSCTFATNRTLIIDRTNPTVNIVYPIATTYGIVVSTLNYTVSDTNLNTCWYSTDSGVTNTSVTCGANVTGLSSSQGSNTWKVWANDSANNVNVGSVTFSVDTVSPFITYGNNTESDGSNISRTNIYVEVQTEDTNFKNVTIRLYNGSNYLLSSVFNTTYSSAINCIQEYANISTSCGGLSTGLYSGIFTYTGGTGSSGKSGYYDGNYVTYAYPNLGTETVFINYTKPQNATNAIWQVKGGTLGLRNLTILSSCFSYSSTLQLKITASNNNGNSYDHAFYCYDGSWQSFYNGGENGATPESSLIYEEAMVWQTKYPANFTGLSEGTYYFNATVYDTLGNVNSTSTRTVTIDTTKPVVNITSPYGTYYFTQATGFNMTLEYRYTDANSHTNCWYNTDENLTNVTLSSCQNTTFMATNPGARTVTVFVNDTSGNIGNFTRSYNIIRFGYSNETYETKNEEFTLTITNTTSTPASATLNYSGTNYIGTISNIAGTYSADVTIGVPLVSAAMNKSFYWTILYSDGTTSSSSQYNQSVSPIIFTYCNGTYNTLFVNYSILDEKTKSIPINANMDSTFKYSLGSSIQKASSFNLSNSTSYEFCGLPNQTMITDATIKLTNDDYETRIYSLENQNYSNNSVIQYLYMANDSDVDNIIIEVRDEGQSVLVGYIVEIYRYYESSNNYTLISSKKTDIFGQVVENLVENEVKYKFKFYDSNYTLKRETSDTIIACRTTICVVPFTISTGIDDFERFENITNYDYTLSFNNVTNTYTFTWNDNTGQASTHRLVITRYLYNGSTVVYNSSSTASSGSLSYAVGSSKASYIAVATRTISSGTRIIATLQNKIGEIAVSIFKREGIFWSFMLLMTFVAIGYFWPPAAIVLFLVGFFALGMIGLIPLSAPIFIGVLVIGGLAIWALRS